MTARSCWLPAASLQLIAVRLGSVGQQGPEGWMVQRGAALAEQRKESIHPSRLANRLLIFSRLLRADFKLLLQRGHPFDKL